MKIVIDIPKSVIEHLKDGSFGVRIDDRATLIDAVMSGTPLPEHHGRLIDELDLDLFAPSLGTGEYVTDLMAKHNIDYVNGDDEDKVRVFALDLIRSCMNVVDTAPTIIEADKGE